VIRVRPGWLIVLCAALLSASVWLPWLTTGVGGGGHATGIGGTAGSLELPPRFGLGQTITLLASVLLVVGAMAGRRFAPRGSSGAALALAVGIGVLIGLYHVQNVAGDVAAGYGWYIGAGLAGAATVAALWTVVDAIRSHP
jgi:hypothetical protein